MGSVSALRHTVRDAGASLIGYLDTATFTDVDGTSKTLSAKWPELVIVGRLRRADETTGTAAGSEGLPIIELQLIGGPHNDSMYGGGYSEDCDWELTVDCGESAAMVAEVAGICGIILTNKSIPFYLYDEDNVKEATNSGNLALRVLTQPTVLGGPEGVGAFQGRVVTRFRTRLNKTR